MANIRKSQKTNFKPRNQNRSKGTGAGRRCFPWKKRLPWLVIAAEQLAVEGSGSADALLEDRQWVVNWSLTSTQFADRLEQLFPGIQEYLDGLSWGKTNWRVLLKNRVYKMFYSGTSDRGANHDPMTRATISREHWRYWDVRTKWEDTILKIVSRRITTTEWRDWI